jgi:hypothetical protein
MKNWRSKMSKFPAIRRAIMDGEVDEYLDQIVMAANNRRKVDAAQKSYTLDEGDTIIIASNCKPRMLSNQPVIFRGRDASKLKVQLLSTYSAKWVNSAIIRIPVTLVGSVVKGASDATRDGGA